MKSQSAMEYLMTYGWSILIIAVVIASLIELGVFNSASTAPSSCIATTGFSCTSPILYSSGALVIKLGQVSTGPMTITGTACTKTNIITAVASISNTTIQSDQQVQLVFDCPITNNATGSEFTGHLWIEYSTLSQQNIIEEVGSVIAPVMSSNTSAYAPIIYFIANGNLYSDNLGSGANTIILQNIMPSGNGYISISNDNKYVYLTSYENLNLYKINLATGANTLIASGTGVGTATLISKNDQYAYSFTSANPSQVYSLNLATGANTLLLNLINQQPFQIALSSNGLYGYVMTSGYPSGELYSVNLATGANTIITSGFTGPADFNLSQDGQYAYMLNSPNILYKINLATGANTIMTSSLGAPGNFLTNMVFSYDYSKSYITYSSSSSYESYMDSLNMATSYITTTNLGYRFSSIIGISADGQYVYLIGLGPNDPYGYETIYEFNTQTNAITPIMEIPHPNTNIVMYYQTS